MYDIIIHAKKVGGIMDFETLRMQIYGIIKEYIDNIDKASSMYMERLNEEYSSIREKIISDDTKFYKLKERRFVKKIIKNEDLSSAPKLYIEKLNSEKRKKMTFIVILYLTALNLMRLSCKDSNFSLALLSILDALMVFEQSNEYSSQNEEIKSIKKVLKENVYGSSK